MNMRLAILIHINYRVLNFEKYFRQRFINKSQFSKIWLNSNFTRRNFMDVIQAFLDGVAIAAIFNGAVATLVLINPRFFFNSYPKDIQKAAPEQMTKQEKKINRILTVFIVGI